MLAALGVAWFVKLPERPQPQPGRAVHGAVVAWSPAYRVSLFGIERLHPFDIGKMDRIAQHLLDEGLLQREDFAMPGQVDEATLAAVHDPIYLAGLQDPEKLSRALEVGVPGFIQGPTLDKRVLAPFRYAVQGSILAARGALEHGLGINLGGGFHHAAPDKGHGFCVLNDVAAAIWTLRQEGFQGQVLIVDTDAHQGDGNHLFFQDDPTVTSFSMHQEALFPIPKERGDEDLGLRGGTGDEAFLEELNQALKRQIERSDPQLIVHVAGSDVLNDDPLAGLAMTPDGLVQRDLLVLEAARSRDIPLLHVLAGGYGPSSAKAQAASVSAMLRASPGG